MKKQWIIPAVIFFALIHAYLCLAVTEAASTKPKLWSPNDLVQITVAKGDFLFNICKKFWIARTGEGDRPDQPPEESA